MKLYTLDPKNDASCDSLKNVYTITSKYIQQGINVELNYKILQIVENEYLTKCLFSEVKSKSPYKL